MMYVESTKFVKIKLKILQLLSDVITMPNSFAIKILYNILSLK